MYIHLIFSMAEFAIPTLPCMCATLRRTARALTQLYEEALRPFGLRATQFTILQALSLTGEVTQGELGRILAIDSTTLTRTLEIMSRQRWITKRRGKDKREWRLRMTKAGKAEFERAVPAWQQVQDKVKREMGADRSDQLTKLANHLTNAINNKGGSS
jgi:DNA-binding MarR family transcriptional regulator